MRCTKATRLASDSLERQLRPGETLGLELHLMICPGCRNFRRQMRALRGFARNYVKGSDRDLQGKRDGQQ